MVADMDLRRLRYFVVVAETLSFVRAAQALHMTQPALSRQIAALEDSIGVRLFDRSRQGTRLTDSGSVLLEGARALLESATQLQREVRVVGRTHLQFTIGFMPGMDATGLIRAFAVRHAELDVSAVFTAVTDQEEFITDGRVDIAFVRLPLRSHTFTVVRLFNEAMVAAVSVDDPLARRPKVRLAEMDRPLQLIEPATGSAPRSMPRPASVSVPEPTARSVEDLLMAVGAAGRQALIPAGIAAYYTDPEIVYVDMADAPTVEVALAYDPRRVMPQLDAFVALCRRELGHLSDSRPEVATAL